MRYITKPFACRAAIMLCLSVFLTACSKPVAFTDYTVENLLKKNLSELTEPRLFETEKLEIIQKSEEGDAADAEVYVTLVFPEDFDTVISMRKLQPFNMEYKQYKSSFGKFAAGERQRHHAKYQFVRRDGKWLISGSQAMSPPEIMPPQP